MAPTASPNEGMLVLVPVGGGAFNRLLDLGPGLEASPFQGQGAQHLPPRLDQVEVGRVLGLKDELPAGMEQAEQQYVRRAVSAEIVSYRIDPLDCGIDPGLDLAQEVDPVGCSSAIIRVSKGRAVGRLEGSENVAAAPPAVVDLLFGPFGLGRSRFHELLAWKAPRCLWAHLVQADHYAARWRRGVELLDDPPFFWRSRDRPDHRTRFPHDAISDLRE